MTHPSEIDPRARAARRTARRRRAIRRRRLVALVVLAAVATGAVSIIGSVGGGDSAGLSGGGAQGQLRWLLPTGGASASIAAENANPGSSSWKLPRPSKQHGLIEGYVSSQDVLPGGQERLYFNAPGASSVRVSLYRMGWYGGRGGRLVARSGDLPVTAQPRCHHVALTGLTECRWRRPLAFQLPESLLGGVYIAKMETNRGATRESLFVVESRNPGPLLVQIPTATYEAYNAWGGTSLYPAHRLVGVTGTQQGVEVSYDRPYDTPSGAGQFFGGDVAMVRFLEREGYPVSYTTSAWVDRQPSQLLGRRLAVDTGHSEYWSSQEMHAFEAARDRGANLAFFSSDTMAWRIRFAPASAASSEAGQPDHRIVAYKEFAARDPLHQPAAFPGRGASLTGTAYQDCITPRIPPGTAAIYHYYRWRPARALQPTWLYRDTGLKPTDSIKGIVGYELDATAPQSPHGIQVVGSGTTPCMGRAPGVSDSTLYRANSGAMVFSSGTLGWQLGLSPVPTASPDAPRSSDPRLLRLTKNLISVMLAGR